MKALIIGGGGFVGRYLAEHLLQDCGWETIVTKLPKETVEVEGCEAYNLDILDKDAVEALLVRHKPDAILHLAAQSSVAYSWKNPQLTADINIHGCLNVLDAVRDIPDYSPKILLIGSGEEYGILPVVKQIDTLGAEFCRRIPVWSAKPHRCIRRTPMPLPKWHRTCSGHSTPRRMKCT